MKVQRGNRGMAILFL